MHVVVLAEDELPIRMGVADSLSEAGFLVLEAVHAEEVIAILTLEAAGVRVLFTDVRIPGTMDGVALGHHVKTHWPSIGLLVTSAHAMLTEDDLPQGGRFLAKPYYHPQVIEQVRELAEVA